MEDQIREERFAFLQADTVNLPWNTGETQVPPDVAAVRDRGTSTLLTVRSRRSQRLLAVPARLGSLAQALAGPNTSCPSSDLLSQ